jgi:hypothetical protein
VSLSCVSGEAHGLTVLGVAYELTEDRGCAVRGPTELTDDAPLLLIEVYALAHQRGAPAVHAVVSIGRQGAHPATQEHALELLDVGDSRSHAYHEDSPPATRLLQNRPDLSRRVWALAARGKSIELVLALSALLAGGDRVAVSQDASNRKRSKILREHFGNSYD